MNLQGWLKSNFFTKQTVSIKILSLAILLIWVLPVISSIDFSNIPPAESVAQSKEYFDKRASLIRSYWIKREISSFAPPVVGFYGPILTRLSLGIDLDNVNSAIISPETTVYSNVGTNFDYTNPFCKRDGDYDFMLLGLTNFASRFFYSGLLYEESKEKLLNTLLTERGNNHHTKIDLGICGTHDETENHILMTEVSRYLTNQLIKKSGITISLYDNEKNGFNEWFLLYLQGFLKRGFSEYNGRPYQGYSVMALQNLYDFTEDGRVKLASRMILDFLAAQFAVQSSNLRRIVPFRRQKEYVNEDKIFAGDLESSRYAILAGNIELFKLYDLPFDVVSSLAASLTSYRIPDLILDLIVNVNRLRYFQALRHEGVEIYYSSQNFLLSGGGIFVDKFDLGTGENDGNAVPLILIPTKSNGVKKSDFIQFEGIKKIKRLTNNMCLAPNFACGINPIIPKDIESRCNKRQIGNYYFFDLAKDPCDYGIYVGLYKTKCKSFFSNSLDTKEFGFFEVIEASKIESFDEFIGRIINNNPKEYASEFNAMTYVTSKGDRIEFTPMPESNNHWPITSINGARPLKKRFNEWKLAKGDIINADGTGLVVIENKNFDKKIILDMRDHKNPKRYE